MSKTNKSVLVLPIRNRKVAVSIRKETTTYPGFWQTVGGSWEEGETAREGACRELLEETGLNVPPDRIRLFLYDEYTRPSGTKYFLAAFLLFLKEGEELACTEPEKHGPWEWEYPRVVLERNNLHALNEVLREFVSGPAV